MLSFNPISALSISATSSTDFVGVAELTGNLPATGQQYEIHDVFDPYERGTFWGKWIARNFYYSAIPCRVLEGYLGDDTTVMQVRNYVIDRVEGPTVDGLVNVIMKDLFSLVEAKKAVAPSPSTGELLVDITNSDVTATLSPTGIGEDEYPLSGYVRLGDEICAFTRVNDTLTLTRAQFNTTADSHSAQDVVQLCLVYTAQLGRDIIYDLLVNYAFVDVDTVPKDTWDTVANDLTELYTATIAEPTAVSDLIGELCVLDGVTLWFDAATNEFNLQPLRSATPTPIVTDAAWIVDQSLSISRQDDKRVSQAWVYYAKETPTSQLDAPNSYRSRVVAVDAEAEEFYGTPAIRKVFARWIPQFGRSLATEVAGRILALYRNPPLEAEFKIHSSRDGELLLATPFYLKTDEVQDDTGRQFKSVMVPFKVERTEDEIAIAAQEVKFFVNPDDEEEGGTGTTKTIFIENNVNNVNLRAVYDTLFSAPNDSTVVNFIVLSTVTVGSVSSTIPALDVGAWPDGTTVTLEVDGRIQGKGGAGGVGGPGAVGAAQGTNGEQGGTALYVRRALIISGDGEIFAGGGGGGGGGGAESAIFPRDGGGGGGGGAGTTFGTGGTGGFGAANNGQPGTDATSEVAGTGGATADSALAGPGGNGGGIAQAGTIGAGGDNGIGAPGTGGAAGFSIDGASLITGLPGNLDVRGAQTN